MKRRRDYYAAASWGCAQVGGTSTQRLLNILRESDAIILQLNSWLHCSFLVSIKKNTRRERWRKGNRGLKEKECRLLAVAGPYSETVRVNMSDSYGKSFAHFETAYLTASLNATSEGCDKLKAGYMMIRSHFRKETKAMCLNARAVVQLRQKLSERDIQSGGLSVVFREPHTKKKTKLEDKS